MNRTPRTPSAALALVLALGSSPPPAAAQGFSFGGSSKAEATLYARVEGDVARVAIRVEIDPGWHLYHDDLGHPQAIGKRTDVVLSPATVEWSRVRFPEPERIDQSDLVEGAWINAHEGTIVLYASGRSSDGSALDAGTIGAEITGLTCEDNGSCVPYSQTVESAGRGPDTLFASFPDLAAEAGGNGTGPGSPGAETGAGTGRAEGGDAGPAGTTARDYASVEFPDFRPQLEAPAHGVFVWLLIAFLAGMILNVMPCVLPVISIKVLSFVQQAGEDRRRVLTLGLAFAAGILVVFVGLAVLAVALGLSWGEQFQSQTFLVVMIGIVFAFSLWLFGVYELGVPAGVGMAASSVREGHADAFFKGMLATALATPCSGPFLGSTLTWTVGQPPLVVFAVFLALGLGMAFPYVLLTANPRLLKVLPKPGPWMETFKQAMGFVLLATVIYLMVSLRQDLLLFTCAFLVFVGLGCWWWGRFASYGQSTARRFTTLAVALGLAAGGAWIAFGPLRGMFEEEQGDLAWQAFDPEAFDRYLADGRSVFVDFTADWCPNCKFNEKWVYEDEEVRTRFRELAVVRIKADLTRDTDYTRMLERLMQKLGATSIPFMALFPGDRTLEPFVRFDIVAKGDLLELLDSLPSATTASR